MKSCSISLLVKNDLLREGLCRLLADNGFEIRQSISDAGDLNFELDSDGHIIIFDYTPGEKCHIKETVSILNNYPQSKSVILSDKFDFNIMKRSFSAGAHGYILNDVPYKTFLAMIELVAMGEKVVPSQFIEIVTRLDVKGRDIKFDSTPPHEFDLNDRDVKILDRLSLGLSNKMISRDLGISEASVKVAVKTIYRKLSVNNRTQAAIIAREIVLPPRPRVGPSTGNGGCGASL